MRDLNLMKAFYRVSVQQEDINLVEAILRERPDLAGKEISVPPDGNISYTVFIGDEVFQAPTQSISVERHSFDRGYEMMQSLEGSGLPVPKVTYVGQETDFYGMTRIPGVVLKDVLDTFTYEDKVQLGKDIAKFIVDLAEALPARDGNFVHHFDLNGGNILVDPETKKLTGVVDFGGVSYAEKSRLCENGIDEAYISKVIDTEVKRLLHDSNIQPSLKIKNSRFFHRHQHLKR